MAIRLLAVVNDLMFQSRIREVAKGLEVEVVFIRPGTLREALNPPQATHVVADLSALTPDDMAACAGDPGVQVMGFGPHVERERFLHARRQGITHLSANSALDRKLVAWLSGQGVSTDPEGN